MFEVVKRKTKSLKVLRPYISIKVLGDLWRLLYSGPWWLLFSS